MTCDSDREIIDNTQQVASHETPSAEAHYGDYPADDDQQQVILNNISLRDGFNPEDLLRELAETAQFARQLQEEIEIMPSRARLCREMEGLRRAYQALGVYARRQLDTILMMELDEAIDDILSPENRPDQMREKGGKKHNVGAHIFILHSVSTYCVYTGRPPPRRCNKRSLFYRFVIAALPPDILSQRDFTDLTATVNFALRRFHRRCSFAPAALHQRLHVGS